MTADPTVVRLGSSQDPHSEALHRDVGSVAPLGVEAQLDLAATWGPRLPLPGGGRTAGRWELLASAGSVDLGAARVLEPHADALAILAEAGLGAPVAGSTWGVYAAEGPGVRLDAREDGGGWRLDGTKPWCSLAGQVGAALVTAWVSDRQRRLFAVDLRHSPEVHVEEATWASRGLASIRSGPVTFTNAAATPVGAPGWYLARDGFAWGGMGVAAIWYGGAVGLARRLRAGGRRRQPDQVGLAHLGSVDIALSAARAVLERAAEAVDGGRAAGAAGELLALRVRGVVAATVEQVLQHVDHALGPGPLTQEEEYARRVADLRVYVRQHHGERDDATLGSHLQSAPDEVDPW